MLIQKHENTEIRKLIKNIQSGRQILFQIAIKLAHGMKEANLRYFSFNGKTINR